MKILPTSPPISDFPSDVLKWMKENVKPKMILKLMQICQYFQHEQFPYFVVKHLWGENGKWVYTSLSKMVYNEDIDIKTLTKPLWITERLQASGDTCLIPFSKIAVCDIEYLILESQTIAFEEFQILAGSGTIAHLPLTNSFIKDENGENIPLEDIIQVLPKLDTLRILHNANSFVSDQKVAEILSSSSLKKIILWNVIEDFNIEACFKLIEKNQQIYFRLHSYFEWSPESTKTIQRLTDNLIEAWQPENQPPNISFNGQTLESKEKLRSLNNLYYIRTNNIAT